MHAASVIMLSWAMIGAACFFSDVLAGLTAALLALLVAVVGLPHGAADHRFAQPRLEPLLGMAWLPVFLCGYVAVAAVVACGWLVAPAVTTQNVSSCSAADSRSRTISICVRANSGSRSAEDSKSTTQCRLCRRGWLGSCGRRRTIR